MTIRDQIKSIIVKRPCVDLLPGEMGFFQAKGQYGQLVEQTVTKKKPGIGIGVAIPVTKHFGIGVGTTKAKTKTAYEKVWKKADCTVLLTDSRFIVKFDKRTVPIELSTIEGIKVNKDAISFKIEGHDQHFFMSEKDVKRFMEVWNLLGEAGRQGLNLSDFS